MPAKTMESLAVRALKAEQDRLRADIVLLKAENMGLIRQRDRAQELARLLLGVAFNP